MKKIDLMDIIHSQSNNCQESFDLRTLAIKQISRARYEIIDNKECKLKIIQNNEIINVYFNITLLIKDLESCLYVCSDEPSLKFFKDYFYSYIAKHVNDNDFSIFSLLSDYKTDKYKYGDEFSNQIWFKFYHDKKPNNALRDLYSAVWIDYEKQLIDSDIIFDENGINGIFACPFDIFTKCFNEDCRKNYGNKFFVLQTISDCQYLFDGKELIGDRFRVIAQGIADSSFEKTKLDATILRAFYDIKNENIQRNSTLQNENQTLEDKYKKCLQYIDNIQLSLNRSRLVNKILLILIFIVLILCVITNII